MPPILSFSIFHYGLHPLRGRRSANAHRADKGDVARAGGNDSSHGTGATQRDSELPRLRVDAAAAQRVVRNALWSDAHKRPAQAVSNPPGSSGVLSSAALFGKPNGKEYKSGVSKRQKRWICLIFQAFWILPVWVICIQLMDSKTNFYTRIDYLRLLSY